MSINIQHTLFNEVNRVQSQINKKKYKTKENYVKPELLSYYKETRTMVLFEILCYMQLRPSRRKEFN